MFILFKKKNLPAETTGFVEKLFECLTTKNYLGNPLAKEIPKEDTKASAPKPAETEEVMFLLLYCYFCSANLHSFYRKHHKHLFMLVQKI